MKCAFCRREFAIEYEEVTERPVPIKERFEAFELAKNKGLLTTEEAANAIRNAFEKTTRYFADDVQVAETTELIEEQE